MSIRTPSETTARPEPRASSGRASAWLLAALLTVAVATGCAEGTARDAERGKARDARETSVVSDLQATRSAQVLLPGTPPPATPTPAP